MACMRARQIYKTVRGLDSLTDGQVKVVNWDMENLRHVQIMISPNDGLYKGGSYLFSIELNDYFPIVAPLVRCQTKVYHPNIDFSFEYEEDVASNVCVSVLGEWQGVRESLDDLLQGLLFLFHNPNLEDSFAPYISPNMDIEEFKENLAKAQRGSCIEGVEFHCVINERDIITTEPKKHPARSEAELDIVNQEWTSGSETVLVAMERLADTIERSTCSDTFDSYNDMVRFNMLYRNQLVEAYHGFVQYLDDSFNEYDSSDDFDSFGYDKDIAFDLYEQIRLVRAYSTYD